MATHIGKPLEKLETGIRGLDEVLEGGIPKGRALLIVGATGCGKTVFLNEFIYRGITKYGQNGVFVTFEETPDDVIRNVGGFGWNYPELIRKNKLIFEDISPSEILHEEIGGDYDMTPLIERIKYSARKVRAKRVAIDMLGGLFARFKSSGPIRDALCRLSIELKKAGLTTLISAEKISDKDPVARFGVEEFVADAVVELSLGHGQQQFVRTMYIRKLRGVGYRSGHVEFEISNKGVEVFPKIPMDPIRAKTSFTVRKKMGVAALDRALGGGIPQGHTVMISGNTGTGKTLLGLQYLMEGVRRGENGLYVAMEEPVDQVKKTAMAHGWNLEKFQKQGKIAFVAMGLIDVSNDKLLYEIVRHVERLGAKRVVFDSLSSLLSATLTREGVRQFLIQMTNFFKTRGVTSVLTYLSGANFGAARGQLMAAMSTNDMRLSSVLDGVILLLYVERKQSVARLLNVLKLRGSKHAKDIFEYEIEKGGIHIQGKFAE